MTPLNIEKNEVIIPPRIAVYFMWSLTSMNLLWANLTW